jgi:hypothetical protein
MGCTVSTTAAAGGPGGGGGGRGALRVGDHVELRRGAPTSDTLGLGEVGELLELSVGGAGRVRGPRNREKWIRAADLQCCPPPGLPALQQAAWWLRHAVPQLRDAPKADPNQFAALGAVEARTEDAVVHEPTHYDFLAPFVPVAALPHVAARSQSLGGAWAGESIGAVLVAQLTGITPLVEEQMAQLGEAGAVRIEQLCEVLHGTLVETARGQLAAVPSSIPHIYGDRLMVCFGTPPSAAGAPASTRPSALALRLAVTVVQVAELAQMDTLGKNDPFVEVAVGDRVVRTTTVDGGGSDASWGIPLADEDEAAGGAGPKMSGETLYFEVPEPQPGETFAVRVFDADLGGQDDLIGGTAVPVNTPPADPKDVSASGSQHCSEGWFEIHRGASSFGAQDQAGPCSGRVYLRVRASWIDDSDRASVAACQCARALQACVREWGADAGLALSCGIGSGCVQWAHLHCDPLNSHGAARSVRRKVVIRGPAVAEAHHAARHASKGDICVAAAVAKSAQEGFRFRRVEGGVQQLLQTAASPRKRADGIDGTAEGDALALEPLELPAPVDVGCPAVRGKAHRDIVPYVPRLAVTFAQASAEFRRVCVLGVQLHGFDISSIGMRQLADLNAAFEDVCATLEAVESDGFINQMGYALSPTIGPNDNNNGSCSLQCLFGLGNSEEVAVRSEENAVRGAVRLSELLREKNCGGLLPVQSQSSTDSVNCVGASIGVASGWAWVGRVGHSARHELCAFGQCVSDSLTLMADPAASGTVLSSAVVEAKVADDFECCSVPPFVLSAETLTALDDAPVFRCCRPKESDYL